MTIEVRPHETRTLLGMYSNVEAPINYFRNLLVSRVFTSTDTWIDLTKVSKKRKLAPLVIPTEQGRPIFSEAARAARFKPAYVKPKDAVSPERVLTRRPTENIFEANRLSPYQRFVQLIADILGEHRNSIENLLEWMCAEAAQYGKLTLSGPDYPTTILDFERKASHTKVLAGANLWSNVDAPIIDKNVVPYFLKNKQVLAERDVLVRGTNASPARTIRNGDYAELVFKVDNYEIWTTSDWYDKPDGTIGEYMNPNGVLLTGPNIDMVQCHGAILDLAAQLQALPVFVKQWDQQDPSGTFVMTQSSPAMVPVNPNNSLFATVL